MEHNKNIKICFLADKHNLFDDRIYWKMAVPLKKIGYDVYYLLIRNKNEKGITDEGIHYEVLKLKTFSTNRYLNFILKNLNPNNNYKRLYLKAKEINAEIYHFHDLWINRIGVKLKKMSHKPVVFYDVHEPYSEDYVTYSRNNKIRKPFIKLFAKYLNFWEKNKSKSYDMIISTENIVRDNFRKVIRKEKVNTLYNFTDNYMLYENNPIHKKKYDFIYSGGITELRGAFKILDAVLIAKKTVPNIKVVFVGKYESDDFKNRMLDYISRNDLKANVELHDFVNYSEISNYYNKSKVGFITPFPEPSFKIKMYIKIFEYMAFGLPTIGSDFGHIKEFLEKDNCGLLVNPLNANDIADAMIKLLLDKELYLKFSVNGRKATLEKYRWEFELEKLMMYYTEALDKRNT